MSWLDATTLDCSCVPRRSGAKAPRDEDGGGACAGHTLLPNPLPMPLLPNPLPRPLPPMPPLPMPLLPRPPPPVAAGEDFGGSGRGERDGDAARGACAMCVEVAGRAVAGRDRADAAAQAAPAEAQAAPADAEAVAEAEAAAVVAAAVVAVVAVDTPQREGRRGEAKWSRAMRRGRARGVTGIEGGSARSAASYSRLASVCARSWAAEGS